MGGTMNIQTRNNINVYGEGNEVLIFVHGFGANQDMWRLVTPAFYQDYKVVLYDHVGSGRSDSASYDPNKYNDLEGYKTDLLEVIAYLDAPVVTLIGHSVGAMISMLAALEKPEVVKQLIMVGPSPRYMNDENYIGGFEKSDVDEMLEMMEMNFVGWASYLAPIAIHQENDEKFAEELKTSFTSTNVEVINQFAKATFYSDYRSLLPQVNTPVLIMQCSDDSIVPETVGDYLAENLPNASLVKLNAKGHYPQLSHPEETVKFIQAYLQNRTVPADA